ncbi:MAG TPA: 2Fe-2S iron-sulfur cluster-binding protein, partial [Bacteroidales bacterium]|nr:2Fe-2S iron-sulfur cluster-binding protein [Bacteroidales bacterium]
MIKFSLNGKEINYSGNPDISLLNFLRNEYGITSVKDGCSGQTACGACMVEIDGKAKLACVTLMKNLQNTSVITTDGIPNEVLDVIAKAFVAKGAVQCGFCTPGLIMRTKVLFQEKPDANREEIRKAIGLNLCRCTGYVKIVDAIELALKALKNGEKIQLPINKGHTGENLPKYNAYDTAIGKRLFVNDIKLPGMLFGALKFSDYPRAIVKKIDITQAKKINGVIKIFTYEDIPGNKYQGIVYNDWPLMIGIGETTNYIGDVIAGVVAETAEIARAAAKKIIVEYEILDPVVDIFEAIKPAAPQVHKGKSNILDTCRIKRGNYDKIISESAYVVSGKFETQRIEHAFLEPESALAYVNNNRLELYSQGQGIYVDRRQIASLLNLPE